VDRSLPRTAIIGAGISGLTAGKMLKDYGVPIGFAQSRPTLFPFVECQSRLLAAYAVGRYALPAAADMERAIDADQNLYTGHCTDSARHTQQVDYFYYEHDIRTRELPAGFKRAQRPVRV
jgi:pyruvate/2-oxoglutarate dehydrogenase complex dihydrolipoamide dehydrogenase (E3) component